MVREIVRILSYQVGENRELEFFEIQTVIGSKSRECGYRMGTIDADHIIEELVVETISNPLLDRERKKSILENLRRLYYQHDLDDYTIDDENVSNIEDRDKNLANDRNDILVNEFGKAKSFATISLLLTMIISSLVVVALPNLKKLIDTNETLEINIRIIPILFGLAMGTFVAFISNKIVTYTNKEKDNQRK